MDNTQNIISLCTGYGGLELGLRRISPNFRTVCYVEIEAFACANLVAKIEQGKLDAAPIWTDLKTFDGEPFRNKVHGIIGGYPCQPFSNAGQRKGTYDPRHLWPYIEKHVRTIRPVWCFFENVSGHLTLGFKEVFTSLRDMGYAVEAGLFTAAEVGAPHKRERLFVLGYTTGQRPCRGVEDGSGQQSEVFRAGLEHKLGNPDSQHRRSHAGGRDHDTETRSTSETELGDSKHNGYATEQVVRRDETERNQRSKEKPAETCKPTGTDRPGDVQGVQGSTGGSKWPARPGQEQYEWEEPRTTSLGNATHRTTSSRGSRLSSKQATTEDRQAVGAGYADEDNGRTKVKKPVKSGMGRTVDGFRSRVDELRLLGNGVVPQTAELAFRTLQEQHND